MPTFLGGVMDDVAVYDPLAPPPRHKPDTKLDRMVTVILGVLSWFLIIAGFPFSMLMCLRIVKEYERVVSVGCGIHEYEL